MLIKMEFSKTFSLKVLKPPRWFKVRISSSQLCSHLIVLRLLSEI